MLEEFGEQMEIGSETVAAVHTHTHTPSIRLINGDCYEKLKEIPNGSVDLVVIDPPYEVTNTGGGFFGENSETYRNGKTTYNYGKRYVMQQIKNIKDGFSDEILNELCRVLKKINIYIWCSKNQLTKLVAYFKTKSCNWNLITWHKTNPIPACGNKYLNDTEYLLFFRETGVKLLGEFKTKFTYYVTKANVEDKKKYLHPTIKPLHIIKNLVINSSKEGDTVLDCFMGSGTTGVACKELNRNFIGIEIDKKYFDIASERINNA